MTWGSWDLFEGLPDKWVGSCVRCDRAGLKKNMVTLYVRDGGKSPVKLLCHLCPECMASVLDKLGVSMPK